MTQDEQEAKSHVWCSWRVLKLSSGRFAVFDGQALETIVDELSQFDFAKPNTRAKAPDEPSTRVVVLTAEELGL